MEAAIKSHVNDLFLRSSFTKEDAGFISGLLEQMDQKQESDFMKNKEYFLNKDDKIELVEKIGGVETKLTEKIGSVKSDLNKSIYIVGLVQLVIIIGSLLGIVNFMLR